MVRADSLANLRDGLYLVAAALEDGEADLAGSPAAEEIRRAYEHLAAAAAEVVATDLEVIALGGGE